MTSENEYSERCGGEAKHPAKGEPMQRTVVVLQGRGNSGKTTTIGLVWKLLKACQGVVVVRNRRQGLGFREIRRAILEVDGVRVGFMSKSEPAWYLEECLRALIEDHCAVIVCATRSYGGSVECIEELRELGWRIRWVRKNRNPEEDTERAEAVVAEVLSAVERTAPVEA
jgi:hypothetical protein